MAQRKNRSHQADQVEVPTTNRFMIDVVSRTDCKNCNVNYNDFCFEVEGLTESGRKIWGVCNTRAKASGYSHAINPLSLTRRPYERKTTEA